MREDRPDLGVPLLEGARDGRTQAAPPRRGGGSVGGSGLAVGIIVYLPWVMLGAAVVAEATGRDPFWGEAFAYFGFFGAHVLAPLAVLGCVVCVVGLVGFGAGRTRSALGLALNLSALLLRALLLFARDLNFGFLAGPLILALPLLLAVPLLLIRGQHLGRRAH